ncbi:CLC1 [Sanghuangporus weigelae]
MPARASTHSSIRLSFVHEPPRVSTTTEASMRGPIRKFSVELLRRGTKQNTDSEEQTQNSTSSPTFNSTGSSLRNSDKEWERDKEMDRSSSPARTRSSSRPKDQERRPSIDRWKKALFSQASKLRVTPRASSLDVSRSTTSITTVGTAVTATTFASSGTAKKSNFTTARASSQTQTPPPLTRTNTPSSLSLSGSLSGSFSLMSAEPDFLSRENELLGGSFSGPDAASLSGTGGKVGGVEIDLDAAASAFPDISLDGSGDIPIPTPSAAPFQKPLATGLSDFDAFESSAPAPVREVKVTGDDEIERFEDQFPDIGHTSPPKVSPSLPKQPTFGATPTFAPRPQPSAFSSTPILQQSLPDEDEPEPIRVWREKQAEEIKKRDEASAVRRQEAITKAERSIDQFYEEYNAKKERNIKENKIQEQEYQASRTDALSAGTTWSRICDHVDLQNSQSKTLARTGPGTTDLTRFKEVLLRLKREGDAAPGAAGY